MKRTLPLVILSVLFTGALAATDPVCIVGAGPAGLTIAHGLKAKGIEAVIFEKNIEVGGKCQAFYDNPTDKHIFHPLGAILYSKETYNETVAVIKQSGVPSVPFAYTDRAWLYNWTTGDVRQSNQSMAEVSPLHQDEIKSYINFWNSTFKPNMTSIGYNKVIPQEFTMTTFEWLKMKKYQFLGTIFVEGMVPYGYGDIREVPILYMLQYFTPDILLFFAGQQPGHITDFQEVFIRYASPLKGKIYLNTTIINIDRSGAHPTITYHNHTVPSPNTQHCSKIVLAFPPLINALKAAKLELTQDEMTVFSPIGSTKYWSGALNVATPDGFIYAVDNLPGVPPDAAGEPVAFLRLFNQSKIATTWSWGKYRGNQTDEDARRLLKETISKFNKDPTDPTAKPQNITDEDVKAFKGWDYFAHYDAEQLKKNYYIKFNELQGKKNTYYASGFNGFETVEFAIRAGKDVVEKILK